MARRANYGFEKRQKEIKKEQKRLAKLEKKHGQKTAETDASAVEQSNNQLNHNQQQDGELE